MDKVGVASVMNNMREPTLRWFGHVKRSIDALVIRCERLSMKGVREVEADRRSFGEVIRPEMVELDLSEDMSLDKRVWKSRIR